MPETQTCVATKKSRQLLWTLQFPIRSPPKLFVHVSSPRWVWSQHQREQSPRQSSCTVISRSIGTALFHNPPIRPHPVRLAPPHALRPGALTSSLVILASSTSVGVPTRCMMRVSWSICAQLLRFQLKPPISASTRRTLAREQMFFETKVSWHGR